MTDPVAGGPEDISQFADSYASFNRIINSLQRNYLELKDEFTSQNEQLVAANSQLVGLSERNLAATEFLNGILNSLSAGVIAVDRQGRVTHFNAAAAAILGVGREQVLGRPYGEVTALNSDLAASALRTVETGLTCDSHEKSIVLTGGRRVHLSVSTAVMRNGEGQVSGAVEVLHDLTKIKKMELELTRLNTLAALGEMAATIAHEVRNPLNAIAGFAALLERDIAEIDPRRATAAKIVRGVETLNKTVSTLLNYTRFQEINKTPVDLRQFLPDLCDRFRADNKTRMGAVTIEVGCAVSTRLSFDPVLMKQVLVNLLQNAVEAMSYRGELALSVRRWDRDEAAVAFAERLLLGKDETVVELIVADSGPGIQAQHRERVFAPFFSTRSGGNGLGLAVVWKIMKAHGGDVYVDDGPRGGAAFHLLLPCRAEIESREHRA